MHRKSRREKTLNLCTNEEEYFKFFVRLHFFTIQHYVPFGVYYNQHYFW
jgi:hypothetical protein